MKDKLIIDPIYKKFNDSFFPMHDPNRTELTNPNRRENPHLIFVRVTSNLAGDLLKNFAVRVEQLKKLFFDTQLRS